jgi:hypothetical protein
MSAGGFGAEEDDPFADTGDTFAGGDEVDLDLEIELERPEGDIIPEGEHPFMVDSIVSTGRGPSGFPNIRFRTVCVDGPGRLHEVLENLSLSPKARFRVVPLLNGLGAPITGKWKARDLIGKKFWGVVEYEEYDGRPQPRFTAFRPGADIETDYVPRPWREEAEAEAVTVGSAQHAQATLGSEFAE